MNFKICLLLVVLMDMRSQATQYTIKILTGREQQSIINFIAQQRIAGYREYPYLYEGTMAEEISYITWLVACPSSATAVAYYGSEPVGFVGGISVIDFDEHFKGSIEMFKQAHINPDKFYYLTDVIVTPEHRGHQLGIRLFKALEYYAKSLSYTHSCCVTESHESHPLKPGNYKPIDTMLIQLKYQKTLMAMRFSWVTRQKETESIIQEHTLTYWIKDL